MNILTSQFDSAVKLRLHISSGIAFTKMNLCAAIALVCRIINERVCQTVCDMILACPDDTVRYVRCGGLAIDFFWRHYLMAEKNIS